MINSLDRLKISTRYPYNTPFLIEISKNDGDFSYEEKRFICPVPAGGTHAGRMLEDDFGVFFPNHCFVLAAAGLYDQRRGDRRPDADSAGGRGRQRYDVAHLYFPAICLRRQRGFLRGHVVQCRRAQSYGGAALADDADRFIRRADGHPDGACAASARSDACVDQCDAGQRRGLPRGLYLLRDHFCRHRCAAVL